MNKVLPFLTGIFFTCALHAQLSTTIDKIDHNETITIDGVGDESFWSEATENTAVNYQNAAPDIIYDFQRYWWKAAWNDTAIFFLVKVEDDIVYAHDHWAADGVELYFRFGGKEIVESSIYSYQDSGVYQVSCRLTESGLAKQGSYPYDTTNYKAQSVEVKTGTHWGYFLEACVSWDYFVEYVDVDSVKDVIPEWGYTFDFDINVQDNDTDPDDSNYPAYEDLVRAYWSSDTHLWENDWATVGSIILDVDTVFLENPEITISSKEVCPDDIISFIAEPAGITYAWDFGDETTSTIMNPDHSYDTAGTYPVSLYLADEAGNDTTLYDTIQVLKNKVISDGRLNISNHNVYLGENITFSAEPDNVSYTWNLGDGTTSTLQSLDYSYPLAGVYPIALTLTNHCGHDTILYDTVKTMQYSTTINKIDDNQIITIDGVGAESFWSEATENTAVNYQNAAPDIIYDFQRYWWKAAWNDTAIFFLVKVEDDIVYAHDHWAADGVELYFRFGGKEIVESYIYNYQDSGVYQVSCRLTESGLAKQSSYPYDTTNYKAQSVEIKTMSHWGYFLEACVSWDYFVEYVDVDSVKDVIPESGYTFDFDINVQDNDTDPDDPNYPAFEDLVRAYWSSDTHLWGNDWSTVGSIILNDDQFVPVKKHNKLPKITIYPNPASNDLYVKGQADHIQMYDMMGKMIMNKPVESNTSMDISPLNPGIYIVKLYHNKTLKSTDKLIISE